MKIFFIIGIASAVSLADQSVQTDWSGGPGAFGPSDSWNQSFSDCDNVSWNSIQGQLSLATTLLATPVSHTIDDVLDGPYTLDTGDIDRDETTDVLVGGYQDDKLVIFFGDDSGTWTEETISSSVDGACGCDLVDIDSDGDLDVLCTTYVSGCVHVYYNSGDPDPEWTEQILLTVFGGGHDIEGFDMDDDGDMDILGAAAMDDRISWWRNDGGYPIEWVEQEISSNVDYPCRIQAVDLDSDGCMDVVASMWEGSTLKAFYGSGGSNPSWTEQVVADPVYGAHSVRAADIDNDGDQDLIVSAMSGHQLLLFRNGGGAPAQWSTESIDAFSKCAYARTGDFDGDGDLDIVASSFGAAGARLYENDGTGSSWTAHQVISGQGSISCIMPADIDSDGALDVVITGYGLDRVIWCEVTEFVSNGWLESTILDTAENPEWASIDWDLSSPGSTLFELYYKTSYDYLSMGNWQGPLLSPSCLSGLLDRYVQYRIELGTSNSDVSPVLREIELNWDPTGIEESSGNENLGIEIVGGNPAMGSTAISVSCRNACIGQLRLYDTSGRVAWSRELSLEENSSRLISISNLPPGMYVLHIANESSNRSVRNLVIL